MIRRQKYILLVALLFIGIPVVKAQQVPLYSLYVMNSYLINPAIAGSAGYSTVNITAREQWLGIEDSPSTYALSMHSRIMPTSFIKRRKQVRRRWNYGFTSGNVGVGGYIFSDRSGAFERLGARFTYAYHLYNKSNGAQISFGLALAGYQYKFNENKIILRDADDNVWNQSRQSIFVPDASFGIYYSTKQYFVGLSVDQLLESTFKFGEITYDQFKLEKNYYLFGGFDFEVDRNLVLTPTALLKFSENGVFQGDLGAKLTFDQSYWAGMTYRTGNAIIVNLGFGIDNYVFAYAFDVSLSNIMRRTYGSHELFFALKWGHDSSRRYRWINR